MSWWITFADGETGCVGYGNLGDGPYDDDKAKAFAERSKGKPVATVQGLPYNARPMIERYDGCMPMCSSPETCKGRSSCPHRYACSE
jgi:hypothetical protein